MTKRIGITSRVVRASNYKEERDALSHDWPKFLQSLDLTPIVIPNSLSSIECFLENLGLEGFVLSGGDNIGDSEKRDSTERSIIKYAIEKNLPVFGVCRGMQVLNNHFGGDIIKSNDAKHVNNPHSVSFPKTALSRTFSFDSVDVNSFHQNLIKPEILGDDLVPFAIDDSDNTIEGFFHKKFPIVGVMWHPERNADDCSRMILQKIFNEKDFWLK